VLDGPSRVVVGGPHAGTVLWPWHRFDLVERIAEAREAFGDPKPQRALAAEVADWPRVTVQAEAWFGYWEPDVPPREDAKLLPGIESIGSTWASMIELERLLIEPYVAHAVERRFRSTWSPLRMMAIPPSCRGRSGRGRPSSRRCTSSYSRRCDGSASTSQALPSAMSADARSSCSTHGGASSATSGSGSATRSASSGSDWRSAAPSLPQVA
jgi:hypothetical protein